MADGGERRNGGISGFTLDIMYIFSSKVNLEDEVARYTEGVTMGFDCIIILRSFPQEYLRTMPSDDIPQYEAVFRF